MGMTLGGNDVLFIGGTHSMRKVNIASTLPSGFQTIAIGSYL